MRESSTAPTMTTTLLIRQVGGETRPYAITETTTIRKLLKEFGPEYQMVYAERDLSRRVIKTVPVDPSELAIDYCRLAERMDDEHEDDELVGYEEDYSTTDEHSDKSGDHKENFALFDECVLWAVKEEGRARVFFNAYTRMVLGLPMWYLDLYLSASDHVQDLEMLLKACLTLGPQETRFALYGNYRSDTSLLVGSAHALDTLYTEDPDNVKFLQYMMHPECETQAHLGITRESALLLHESGLVLGSRRYWFALQGTTLFYFRSPTERIWRRSIENIDQCRIVYRGSNYHRTKYSFDIVEKNGKAHRCKSHSKRRVEKWVTCLQRCHPSREINEPISMEMIEKIMMPRETPPLFEVVPKGHRPRHPSRYHHHHQEGDMQTEVPDETCIGTIDYDKWIGGAERMLKAIEMGAETLLGKKKLRKKEVSVWVDSIRSFLKAILKIERAEYAEKVVPEVRNLVTELVNFTSIVEGRSEFVQSEALNSECIDAVMDSVNGLFALFNNTALEEASCPEQTAIDKEGRSAMIKLRRALRKPIMQTKIGKISGNAKKEVEKKNEKKGGLFDWFGRMTSKKDAKIPAEEVKELSITEMEPSETVPNGIPSALSSQPPSQPTSKPASRSASQPQTPKIVISTDERYKQQKERYWKQEGGEATPKKISIWSRLGFRSSEHSRKPSKAKEDRLTVPKEKDVDVERVTGQFKKTHKEVQSASNITSLSSSSSNNDLEDSNVIWHRRGRSGGSNKNAPLHPSTLRANAMIEETGKAKMILSNNTTEGHSSEFASIIDNYEPQQEPPSSPWIPSTQSHKNREARSSHRRGQSLRIPPSSSSSSNTNNGGKATPTKEDHSRRKSVIEIDHALLSALLRDQRLARLIFPKDFSEAELSPGSPRLSPGLTHSPSSSSLKSPRPPASPFVEVNCDICSQIITTPKDLKKTPFAAFHAQCLLCDGCGAILTTQAFRLEKGRPFCRAECKLPPVAESKPLKSILKKAPDIAAS